MTQSQIPNDDFVPRSAVMKTLTERGYINQTTASSELDASFEAGIVPA